MSLSVFVVDAQGSSLMPCHPARARELLKSGRAVVHRHRPFSIQLLDREGGEIQPLAVKIDPGYKNTGLAIVVDGQRGKRLIWAAVLEHRGHVVVMRLKDRRAIRRGRRTRKLRYRSPRFNNRREKYNRVSRWLPPSMHSRISNITTWTRRLTKWAPVSSLALEDVKFDTQRLQDAEIRGVAYQQGELFGYEVWTYLLEKWERKCAYCGKKDVPLEREHIVPKSRGGTNRVSNLTLSCRQCNIHKGNQTAGEFGHPEVQARAKQPLRAAAALTATRKAVLEALQEFGLPIETGTGGRTYFNRVHQGYVKSHWIDAACVGRSGAQVYIPQGGAYLRIKALGRGSRQLCGTNKHGFPIRHRARHRQNNGFRSGDLVVARPKRGRRAGRTYRSVVISNASTPSLALRIERNFFTHHRNCILLQRADGYSYKRENSISVSGDRAF